MSMLMATPGALFAEQITQTLVLTERPPISGSGTFPALEEIPSDIHGINVAKPVSMAGAFDERGRLRDDDVDFLTQLDPTKPYTIQLVSGEEFGSVARIDAFTANELTTIPDLRPRIDAGDRYEIREDWTIAEVFGANNEAGLTPIEDEIWIPTGDGTYRQIYWNNITTITPRTPGWRFVGQGNIDASATVLPFYLGFAVERNGDPISVMVTGEPRGWPTRISLPSGTAQPLLLNRITPTPSTLIELGIADQMVQGDSGTADIIWNPQGDDNFTRIYYNNYTIPFPPLTPGLRSIGGGETDASIYQLSTAFLFEHRASERELIIFPRPEDTSPIETSIDLVKGFNLVGLEALHELAASGVMESDRTDADVDFIDLLGPSGSADYLLLGETSSSDQFLKPITSWTTNELTFDPTISAEGFYRIHRPPTISSVFDAEDGSTYLQAGSSNTADIIWLSNNDRTYTRIYRNNTVGVFPPLNPGWRAIGGGDSDFADFPINPLLGFFIERRSSEPLSIPVTGYPITIDRLETPFIGFNAVARRFTYGYTLGQLTSNSPSLGIRGGDEESADIIWLPKGDGTYERVYFNSVIKPFPPTTRGWRRIGSPANEDVSGLKVPSAFIYENRN